MKKNIVSLVLVFGVATALFGLEWGGVINNSTLGTTSDFKDFSINQSNGIHLNLTSAITKDKSLRFATEGYYKYTLAFENDESKLTHIVDLSLLKLSGNWNINGSVLTLNVGRFNFFDKTGFVFGQQSDGVNINYTGRNWSLGAYAGYTGLLNRFTTPMYDNEYVEQKMAHLYDLSYGYVPLMLDFTLTNVGGNVIGMQGQYYLDLTNKVDKAYGSLFVKGPIGNICSYYVAGVVGSNNFKDLMVRANVNLQFVLGSNYMFSVGADYSSGNDKISPFKGITIKTVHSAVEGIDSIVPRISFTYANEKCVFNAAEKIVMSMPKEFEFNGLDSNVSFVYNIFSDLQLGSSLNAYTDFNDKDNNKFSVSVNANFVF